MRTVEESKAIRKRYNHLYGRNVDCELEQPTGQHYKAVEAMGERTSAYVEEFCLGCEGCDRCVEIESNWDYDNGKEVEYLCDIGMPEDEHPRPYGQMSPYRCLCLKNAYRNRDKVYTEAWYACDAFDRDIPEIYLDLFNILKRDDDEYWSVCDEVCGEECGECKYEESCYLSFEGHFNGFYSAERSWNA